jgi:hypothetical protein
MIRKDEIKLMKIMLEIVNLTGDALEAKKPNIPSLDINLINVMQECKSFADTMSNWHESKECHHDEEE